MLDRTNFSPPTATATLTALGPNGFPQVKRGTYPTSKSMYITHILSLSLFVLLSKFLGGVGRSRNHSAAVN